MRIIIRVIVAAVFYNTVVYGGLYNFEMDEYLLQNRWRSMFTQLSPVINPSFVLLPDKTEIRTVFCPVLNSFYLYESGLILPLAIQHSLGLSCIGQTSRSIKKTELRDGIAYATGETINHNNGLISVSYAFQPMNNFGVGTSLILAYQNAQDNQKATFALDFGMHYRSNNKMIGLALQNVLPSTKIKAIDFEPRPLLTMGATFFDGYCTTEGCLSIYNLNRQYYSPLWDLQTRIAMVFPGWGNISALLGFDGNGINHGGFAAEINLAVNSKKQKISIAWQYVKVMDDGVSQNSVYTRLQLGPSRLSEYILYRRAMSAFRKQQYWNALVLFGYIESQYPEFVHMDKVVYYMAECFRTMLMYEQARGYYEKTVRLFQNKELVSNAHLGLLKTAYSCDATSEISRRFSDLIENKPSDSIRACGIYLYSQWLLSSEQNKAAFELLSKVPKNHYLFPEACFSKATAAIRMGKYTIAENELRYCIDCDSCQSSTQEIRDRSICKLAMLYFEHDSLFSGSLDSSQHLWTEIQESSAYYTRILSVMAWSAFRQKKWRSCGQIALKLIKKSVCIAEINEGVLLLVTSLASMGNVEKAHEIIMQIEPESYKHEELQMTEKKIHTYGDERKASLDSIASTGLNITEILQHSKNRSTEPAMAMYHREYKKNITRYNLITKNLNQLRKQQRDALEWAWLNDDIQYVLAKILLLSEQKKK